MHRADSRLLVIGAGWLGSAIARDAAARGVAVWSMRRSASSGDSATTANGDVPAVRTIQGDITQAESDAGLEELLTALTALTALAPHMANAPFIPSAGPAAGPLHVVLCVSPSRARGDSHGSLYPAAARGAARLVGALGARTLVYTSSTGVYGVTDGSWVTEERDVVPHDERQRALFEAEQAVLHHPPAASHASHDHDGGGAGIVDTGRVVLRVAGLYGPARDPGPRFASGVGLEEGGMFWCNFAWRDDVVAAVTAVQADPAFHRGAHVFNCADGRPVLARDIARALGVAPTERDGHAWPESPSAAGTAVIAGRQRIAVDRLRATGWSPRVPDVYAGLALLGHTVTRQVAG